MTDAIYPRSNKSPANDPKVVTLTGRDVEDARRLLALLSDDENSESNSAPQAKIRNSSGQRSPFLSKAREILENRRKRSDYFSNAIFGEPAWEMLLTLYVASGGRRQTVSRLAELSGTSRATALRWMEYLADQRMISRDPHPTDKRSAFVELSDRGREALEKYFTAIGDQRI